jgi:glyoxylate/hydroxypyruvate reductase
MQGDQWLATVNTGDQAARMQPIIPYVRQAGWVEHDDLLDALITALPEFEVVALHDVAPERLVEIDVAIVDGPDPEQLATLPNLRWVQSTWAGVEALLAGLPHNIQIARMIDPQLADTMSEAVLAWTLYLHRDMPRYARQQRVGDWRIQSPVKAADRRVGILGLGVLGVAAAMRLAAQGFDTAGWSRSERSIESVETFDGDAGFEQLLRRSDIVVNLLPHTAATMGLLGADAFATMPNGASLINFGRGSAVGDDALLAALDAGHLAHAVLDVFDTEPLPAGHRYWSHESVTVLPHISGPTTSETAAFIAAANVRHYLATGELPADAMVSRVRGY